MENYIYTWEKFVIFSFAILKLYHLRGNNLSIESMAGIHSPILHSRLS